MVLQDSPDLVVNAANASIAAVAKGYSATGQISTFGLLGRVILAALKIIPSILLFAIAFATITVPTWMYWLLSTSLTFTVNFSTLAFLLVALISSISYFLRYRFHAYTRLAAEPIRREPEVEIFPDPRAGESKTSGLSNYLDEFLSAIKVFGYLEKPVFHELTRTMQTRRLIAGETILLEEEKGFCLVVEGTVQIFVRSRKDGTEPSASSEDEEPTPLHGRQGYQLISEVKNGAPLSSLFSILSLFTEEVNIGGMPDGSGFADGVQKSNQSSQKPRSETQTPDRSSPLMSPTGSTPDRARQVFPVIPDQDITPAEPVDRNGFSQVPPLSLESSTHPTQASRPREKDGVPLHRSQSAHPNIVARAATDATIAIIPAAAFRRLIKSYPKATAHIIQVILNRFYRVTLATGYQYLGLTQEILATEKTMNKFTTCELPDFLRDSALEALKEKFRKERDRIGPEEVTKGIALHNPRISRRRRSSSMRKDATAHARLHSARTKNFGSSERAASPEMERTGISAGDLLTNSRPGRVVFSQPLLGMTPGPRGMQTPLEQGYFSLRPVQLERRDSMNDDEVFREAILECFCTAMGLTGANLAQRSDSIEQSPKMLSYDTRKQKAVFNNAFGIIDAYEAATENDTESVISAFSQGPNTNMLDDMIDDVDIVYFTKGSVLVEQEERLPGLYYVIDGFLDVSVALQEEAPENDLLGVTQVPQPPPDNKGRPPYARSTTKATEQPRLYRQSLFLLKPGSLAGYLPATSGFRSFVTVTAKSDVIVGFLPRASLERIVEKYPIVLFIMAKRLTTVLDRMILHIDFALEYLQVNAGQVIFDQGDQADAIYIVLNGRLRAIEERQDKSMRILGEYGQGESVGELEVLTETKRPGSLHAQRDTEIAKLPKMLFNSLAQEHPAITLRMSKILAKRMRAIMEGSLSIAKERSITPAYSNPASIINLRTVCILPVTAGVPVTDFAARLTSALTQIGTSVVSLNQSAILNHLGRHAFSRMGKLKLSQYLADLEEKYGMVLYVADTSVQSPWTSSCITQSDCILLVALADGSPEVGEYERFLLTTKTTARKELVLLHNERLCPPGLTRKWLRNRMWVNGGHHHIQMHFSTSPEPVRSPNRRLGLVIKQRVQVIQAEIQKYTGRRMRQTPLYSGESPFKGDFHRLARRLCGKSIGLVLGGGGARGIAHVGIIRALEEAGIPIDIVGGTSIGAFIGALYAWDASIVPMYGRIKRFAGRMGSMWRFVLDLTYPTASWTTGHEFNRGIFKTFGDYLIEDFWLPYYCNTTNISQSRAEFHTTGYVWRYVRASMSLAGLLPPLCDEGSMLLDGGYIDNLTVEHMKSLGADVIFAVDVGSLYDNTPQYYGDSLSGFWTLLNKWNPFSSSPNPPSLSEIQSRLAYVSSVDTLERAKNMPGCHYMRPAIDPFGTLQFGSFDEIYKVGYDYGKEYMSKLKEDKILPIMEESEEKKLLRRTTMSRRASI